jgi:hypothetical protein
MEPAVGKANPDTAIRLLRRALADGFACQDDADGRSHFASGSGPWLPWSSGTGEPRVADRPGWG